MRETLYRTATRLFAERGFEETTLRDIAAAADVSPALLYRYFPSKRAVVLALYDELSLAFADRAQEMPRGTWRERFLFALTTSLDVLGPHRGTLVALVPVLVGGRDANLFAPATAFSRERVQQTFVGAATGAKDAPRGADAAALGRVLYLAHLGVLLWWLLDRSRGQAATARLVAVLGRILGPVALALRLPGTRSLVRDLDALAERALFGDDAAAPA
jgi:AcrR family transcriptional regulator